MKRIGLALGIIIIIAIAWHGGLADYLSLSRIKEHSDHFTHLVKNHYVWSSILYITTYIGTVLCGLPATIPLTILGGYLFGLWWGTLYAIIGATTGSIAYFLLIRYVLSKKATEKYADRLMHFKQLMLTHGPSYLLFLHFITIVPYIVINTLAALAQVRLSTFIWTTIVGAIPSLVLYSFAGKQLGVLESTEDILKPQFLLLFLVLAIIALIPIIIKKYRAKKNVN